MPIPSSNVCEIHGQRQFFRKNNSQCNVVPFFLPDIIKGMYLHLGSNCEIIYKFQPSDAIIPDADLGKLTILCSVETMQKQFEGGLWILDTDTNP